MFSFGSRLSGFNLSDYRLYDYVLNVISGNEFGLSYDDVSDFMNERSFYYSKKKLIDLGFISKVGTKRYCVCKK